MTDKISDNVGKKIVEALKMQSAGNVSSPVKSTQSNDIKISNVKEDEVSTTEDINDSLETEQKTVEPEVQAPVRDIPSFSTSDIDTAFQNSLNNNLSADNFMTVQTDVEYPHNVVILNHLISKLPTGVTKQTGAVIIRQTMEALGIPMKSVLQEARQVQEVLSNKAKECQRNILDYKKQIAELETKSQQYQRQSVVMNDTINLFLSTGF